MRLKGAGSHFDRHGPGRTERGAKALIAEGSRVIVQDEASSVVWGMPGFVARAGLAEKILPLTEIGPEIERRVARALQAAP